jgi:predicted O-methyltransferase YrrM
MQANKIFTLLFIFLSAGTLCYSAQSKTALSKDAVSQYLKERLKSSDKRYSSFCVALKLLKQREAKVLVETGTARFGDKGFIGDGGSTIIFGDWANQNDAVLNSVDIDSSSIDKAKEVTQDYSEHIQFSLSDSVMYLEEFSQPIDLLYLDSYEYDSANPEPSQTHHLNELIAAYPYLHEKSIVMIDDCELANGGQGKMVIEYLLDKGWKITHQGYQTILTQE